MTCFAPLELACSDGRFLRDGDDLRLRPWRQDDAAAVTRACSDPETQRWLPVVRPYTREDAALYIAGREVARRNGEGVFCAVTLGGDTVVGSIGLSKADWRARVIEVGYWSLPEHRRRGYMTAAVRAISRWVIARGFTRVELKAAPANLASNRVAVRAGFRFEGVLRETGIVHGGRSDLNLYAFAAADVPGRTDIDAGGPLEPAD